MKPSGVPARPGRAADSEQATDPNPGSIADEAPAAEPAPATTTGGFLRTWQRMRRNPDVAALAAIVLGSVVLVSLHVTTYTQISPIDELPHIDSMIRTSEFELPRISDRVGHEALGEEACRGLDRQDVLPPCDAEPLDPAFFQDFGENTVAWKFPVYHFVTGLLARGLKSVAGLSSLVTAARLLGAAWLAVGLAATWALMGELRLSRPARVPALVLVATVPVVLHTTATVNSDATMLATGAGILLAALRWERRALHSAWFVGLVVLAVVMERATLLAVGAAGVYLAGRWLTVENRESLWRDRFQCPAARRLLLGAILLGVAAGAGPRALEEAHWKIIGETDDVAPYPPDAAFDVQHIAEEVQEGPVPGDRIAREYDALITPIKRPYTPDFLSGTTTTIYNQVAEWLLLAGLFGAIVYGRGANRLTLLATATLVVLLAGGPLHAYANAQRDVFFATPARFGLALLPALAVFVAAALKRRAVLMTVSAFVAFGAGNAVWRMV